LNSEDDKSKTFQPRYVQWKDMKYLRISGLTREERNWVKRFGKVMADMPKRLLLLDAGDRLDVVDLEAEELARKAETTKKSKKVKLQDRTPHTLATIKSSQGKYKRWEY